MKKINPPNHSHSKWGQLLLAAGLLLICVVGFFQLYEVQAFLSPEKYHATQLNLIRKDFTKIEKGLKSLRTEVGKLNGLCMPAAGSNPQPSALSSASSPLPQSDNWGRPNSDPVWQATLHTAKKERVFVVRKLKYIDAKLQSMQRASSHNATLVARNPETEETLGQIQEIQVTCQNYKLNLNKLAEQLDQLEGCKKQF